MLRPCTEQVTGFAYAQTHTNKHTYRQQISNKSYYMHVVHAEQITGIAFFSDAFRPSDHKLTLNLTTAHEKLIRDMFEETVQVHSSPTRTPMLAQPMPQLTSPPSRPSSLQPPPRAFISTLGQQTTRAQGRGRTRRGRQV